MRSSTRLFIGSLVGVLGFTAAGSPPTASAGVSGYLVGASVGDRSRSSWVWPVATASAVVRRFEAPPTQYSAGHRGVDIRASRGNVVLAPTDGVVSFAGTVVDRPLISITSEGGFVSSVEPVNARVTDGETVSAGQVVGEVAEGGHCSGICAHFGVRLFGHYVNPLALLEDVPRAVLLPVND